MPELHVLIVDDEGELAFTLAERLNLRGFLATAVTSGEAALERLATDPPDVMVLDVKMPGLGGLEAIRRIKASHPELPVILMTGHGSRESADEGLQLGAFRYLMKPVQLACLVELLLAAAAGGEVGRACRD